MSSGGPCEEDPSQNCVSSLPEEDESNFAQGRWTDLEHKRFIKGLKLYGKDWLLL